MDLTNKLFYYDSQAFPKEKWNPISRISLHYEVDKSLSGEKLVLNEYGKRYPSTSVIDN